jgi:hypothetical protein
MSVVRTIGLSDTMARPVGLQRRSVEKRGKIKVKVVL